MSARTFHRAAPRPQSTSVIAVVAGVMAIAAVAARVGASAASHASTLVAGGDPERVIDVVPGSLAWRLGARLGDLYERWPDDTGGIVRGPTMNVGIPDQWLPLPWTPAAISAASLVVAVLVVRYSPVGAWVLATLATVVAASDLGGVALGPVALVALVAPGLAAGVVVTRLWQDAGRLTGPAAVILVATLGLGLVAFDRDGDDAVVWTVSALVPLLVLLALGAEIAVLGAVRLRARLRAGEPASVQLVRATPVGRRALMVATETERDRIAQRVHDRVLPGLRSGVLALETGDTARSRLELTRLANGLRADIMGEQLVVLREAGIMVAIEDHVVRIGSKDPRIDLSGVGERGRRVPAEVELAAYRVAQEAINNAVAHASARVITVTIDWAERHLGVTVKDDGIGVDMRPADSATSHLGRTVMAAQAAAVGASVQVADGPDRGTVVRFAWPA